MIDRFICWKCGKLILPDELLPEHHRGKGFHVTGRVCESMTEAEICANCLDQICHGLEYDEEEEEHERAQKTVENK